MYDVPPPPSRRREAFASCQRPPAAMNAPNPLMPESRPLSEPTLEQLRKAIQGRRQSPAAGDETLRGALRVVAAEARERSLRPEELIVALKQVLDESHNLKSSSAEERQLREWVVTTCIHAYFEDG
jgi:hypothetical protein